LAGVKSLNRLDQVLARNEWHEASIAEGLMLDTDGNLIGGTMSNVFLVSGTSLVTPAIVASGVCGVMRRHILALSEKYGLDASVQSVSSGNIRNFSEIFLSNSQIGVWPVRQCANARFIAPGPVTRRLMSLLLQSGIEECRT
jgi:4-amino-4-deoxychorismate lyase